MSRCGDECTHDCVHKHCKADREHWSVCTHTCVFVTECMLLCESGSVRLGVRAHTSMSKRWVDAKYIMNVNVCECPGVRPEYLHA